MIPKIIHFCWLSGDKYPPLIERCIASWKEKLSDYEFILWDTNKFDLNESKWVKQAFEAKKYAFAADYIRLYAVYNYGGIYLDSDVEVVKKFDDLLKLPYFIGTEGYGLLEAGIFGAEKGTSWIGDCLKHYENRNFIKNDESIDTRTLPSIMGEQIRKNRSIIEISGREIFQLNKDEYSNDLFIFPKDYFSPKDPLTLDVNLTNNSYCIHHFDGSWLSPWIRYRRKLRSLLLPTNVYLFLFKIFIKE